MGKLSERQTSLLIAAAVLLGGLALGTLLSPEKGYSFPEPLKTVDVGTTDLSDKAIIADETFVSNLHGAHGRTNFREKRMYVDETFVSNLPLVLIDTDGERPPAHILWDVNTKQYVPNELEDIYVNGEVFIFDNRDGTNCLGDTPVIESNIRLRRRGNSSVEYDKHQYLVKLVDEEGKANRQDLLQMGADNEWVLNVSFIDKSLLRNYLAYMTAGEIMPYTPDVRYCEVVWRDGNRYCYEGVYLLAEKIKVGKDRVDLPRFSENSAYLPFLLRRDRYEPDRLLLDNYARKEGLLDGVLRVEWPAVSNLSGRSIQRITDQIDRFEETLFAEDYNTFLSYRNMIDVNSFVDYLILNEFFINYDAGFHSTYIYSDYSGKIAMGPVWDFDGAIDNYNKFSANIQTAAFFYAPWFEQILRDPEFTLLIIERYKELRKGILSDQSIQTFIDGTVEGLGSAIDRDWARWGYFYQEGNYLQEQYPGQPDRNTKGYAEEVEKIKRVLSEHGTWLDEHMDTLYQLADPASQKPDGVFEETDENIDARIGGDVLAVIFVVIFFISVILIQRMERGD